MLISKASFDMVQGIRETESGVCRVDEPSQTDVCFPIPKLILFGGHDEELTQK